MATSKNQPDFSKKPNVGANDFQASQDAKKSETSNKESISHTVGDKLERAGEKIKNAGAESLGNAIYKAGNKIEHMQDKKKSH